MKTENHIEKFKMSRKGSKLGALALIGSYSGESEDDEIEEIIQPLSSNPADIVTDIILVDILPKVVHDGERKDDVVMFIDHNPSFDVYRGRKREMSESSSVVMVESLDCTADISSTSRLNHWTFLFRILLWMVF